MILETTIGAITVHLQEHLVVRMVHLHELSYVTTD